jgi:murein DD-endopeptidase MepM/ murein hydrolase activator NlpD
MRRICFIALALMSAGMAVALLPALSQGQSTSAIESKLSSARSKLDRVRGNEHVLTSDIAAMSGKIHSLEREIGGLRRRESKAERMLVRRRANLARVTARYEVEHGRYVRLRKQLHRSQVVLAERLVAIYEADEPDFITVVLNADGFRDLLERADYVSRIGDQDSKIVDRVRELKMASARKRQVLVQLKLKAEGDVEFIAAQKKELVESRTSIESREADLASTRRSKQGALAKTRVSRRELEGEVRALEAASARVQQQLGGGNVPAGPIRHGNGSFIWPVNGPVVSPFGMRWGRLHAGVDIAVPSGTPVRAAGSGSVAIAGWMGGYGNYTCIQHGGGIATCYGHQSSIGV